LSATATRRTAALSLHDALPICAAITVTGRQLKVLDEGEGAEGAEEREVASYSQVEVLRQKDFDTLTEAEMAEVRRLIRLMRLPRSEEHTSELQSRSDLVCRLLL